MTQVFWCHINGAQEEVKNLEVFLHRGFSSARVTESSGPGVMIHKVANSFPCVPDLPPFRKGILILKPSYKHMQMRT